VVVFPVWARESPSRKPHPRNQAPSPKTSFLQAWLAPANAKASPAARLAASRWVAQPAAAAAAAAAIRVLAPMAPTANFTSTTISASFDDDEACGNNDWDNDEDLDDMLND
jgi:hypothetical protein